VKKWPWTKIFFGVACLLVLVGVEPLAYMFWEGENAQPLSMPLPLKSSEYASPYFRTYLSGNYQIQMEWAGRPDAQAEQAVVDLDWKIVDESGAVIQQGTYSELLDGANNVNLGEYRPKFGQRQRIITIVHQDVQGSRANATLEIGQPEISLDLGYGAFLILGWACLVGGSGAIVFCVLLIRRMTRGNALAPAA
jgi:hypothetical protein